MIAKPTYEMLEKRITELEARNSRLSEVQSELQRSLNFIESMLAALPTPIFYKDTEGKYQGCNEAFTEVMGVTAEQLRGKAVHELWPSEHAERYHQMDLELLREPQLQIYEFEVKDKNGLIRPVIYYKNVFRDEKNAIAGLVGGFADISETRKAQSEIHRRQKFLESVLYHAPDAIVTLDEKHHVIDWNPGAVKMFGYSPGEVIGKQLDELVTRPNKYKEAKEKTEKVLSGERVEAFETIRYRQDGTPLNVIAAGSPIILEGELKGVVVVYTDITGRVQSEEALKVSHQRFLKVLDSINATIYVADMETYEILFMNNHMIKSFGGDYTGQKCFSVFRKESTPCSVCSNDRLVDDSGQATDGVAWQGQNPVTGKWYMNYDRAIEWTDGRMVKIQIAMDITDYKKMEEALAKAQKMEAIGTLASGIAHDFNNLLMGIQGHNSLIAVDLDPSHPLAEHTAAIDKHVKSAANLTQQLLGLVRGGKYEVKSINMNELLESSAEMFGRTHKEIRVQTKTTQEPMIVEADKHQIEQVLLNIYVNALQAMPGGGDLYLETKPIAFDEETSKTLQISSGEYVEVSLTDSGVGIGEDILDNIFDPFFTTKEKSRGTGLGLASAYGVIKNHGGTISVLSEVGRGSTFNLYLPLSRGKIEMKASQTSRLAVGNETILLIDDEEMITEVGKALLERMGYRVITAGNSEEALAAINEENSKIDLVILDLIMPGVSGGATFDQIRQIIPTMPVLLSSGYSINGEVSEILDRGCNGFIQKPFDINELSEKIRSVLKLAKSKT